MSVAAQGLGTHAHSWYTSLNERGEFADIEVQLRQGRDYAVPPLLQRQSSFASAFLFQGALNIPGLPLLPACAFAVSARGNIVHLQSDPVAAGAAIAVELEVNPNTQTYRARNLGLLLADESVDAWVVYSRLLLALSQVRTFSIQVESPVELAQAGELYCDGYQVPADVEKKRLSKFAALCRKLQFIQEVFNVKLKMPRQEMSASLSRLIEILYRGITEGEFSVRSSSLVFADLLLSKYDLQKPPFTKPGLFSHKVGPDIVLLGKRFIVGSVVTTVKKAAADDASRIEPPATLSPQPVDVGFAVLDHIVKYRFDVYAQKAKKERLQKLRLFKQKLADAEPQWMVDLLDESLQNEVSAGEAAHIARGWQRYSALPDRFSLQTPLLDRNAAVWRVPVRVLYPGGVAEPVGELLIDLKTGKLISQPERQRLYGKGKSAAEESLYARNPV